MAVIKRTKNQIVGLQTDLDDIDTKFTWMNQQRVNEIATLQTFVSNSQNEDSMAISNLESRIGTVEGSINALNVEGTISNAIAQEVINRDNAIAQAISIAQLNVGKDYTVANQDALAALTGLAVYDRVMVQDDGDGKWAVYQVTEINQVGAAVVLKIIDQDSLTSVMSASAIKQAYESNSDTNAFTDVDAAKVAHISVTGDIDLDTVLHETAIDTDGSFATVDNTHVPSTSAVKTYVEAQIAQVQSSTSNFQVVTESTAVVLGQIHLQHAAAVILNFGTVRYTDINGTSFDVTVSLDTNQSNNKTYYVMSDTPGQFDGQNVLVQYIK